MHLWSNFWSLVHAWVGLQDSVRRATVGSRSARSHWQLTQVRSVRSSEWNWTEQAMLALWLKREHTHTLTTPCSRHISFAALVCGCAKHSVYIAAQPRERHTSYLRRRNRHQLHYGSKRKGTRTFTTTCSGEVPYAAAAGSSYERRSTPPLNAASGVRATSGESSSVEAIGLERRLHTVIHAHHELRICLIGDSPFLFQLSAAASVRRPLFHTRHEESLGAF